MSIQLGKVASLRNVLTEGINDNMTITIAWERRLPGYSELLFCSDSRLTGGGNIDVCQKVFPLPREDGAIAFCGSTLIAYPIVNQFMSYVRHHKQNLDRALDGSELPKRFASLVNQFLLSYIDAADLRSELLETSFVIGCFSVKLRRPVVRHIRYDGGPKQYVVSNPSFPRSKSQKLNRSGGFVMIGDLRHHYYDELSKVIDYRSESRFDMEPFTALSKMLGNPAYTNRHSDLRGPIGGAPQLLKVYPFFRAVEFGVHWPSRTDGNLYLNGRQLFDYEKITIPQIDCSSLDIYYPLEELREAGEQWLGG